MIGRTVVFTTSSDVEAALVSGLLEAEGLEAAIERSPLRSVFPVPIAFFGQLRITVPAAVADEARELLARFATPPAPVPSSASWWPMWCTRRSRTPTRGRRAR